MQSGERYHRRNKTKPLPAIQKKSEGSISKTTQPNDCGDPEKHRGGKRNKTGASESGNSTHTRKIGLHLGIPRERTVSINVDKKPGAPAWRLARLSKWEGKKVRWIPLAHAPTFSSDEKRADIQPRDIKAPHPMTQAKLAELVTEQQCGIGKGQGPAYYQWSSWSTFAKNIFFSLAESVESERQGAARISRRSGTPDLPAYGPG